MLGHDSGCPLCHGLVAYALRYVSGLEINDYILHPSFSPSMARILGG